MHSQVFANYGGCKQEAQGDHEVGEMASGQIFWSNFVYILENWHHEKFAGLPVSNSCVQCICTEGKYN